MEFPSAPEPGIAYEVVELGFTGDTMVHGQQVKAARQPDGSYAMDGLFDAVAPWMREVDVMAANLETTISGEDMEGYTGYPRFNSPPAILDELKEAGVDLLMTTNNHCLDRGEQGLLRTLDAVEAHGFAHMGTFRTQPERLTRPFAMVTAPSGLKIAYLGYTYGTEGMLQPSWWWRVSFVPHDLFGWEIGAARAAGADLVVVGVHWGREYKHAPDPAEVALAHRIVELGADVVWGTHPHVLQPAEVVTVEGDRGPRDALILYSLGNFVSNQRDPNRDGGVIVRLSVLHDPATREARLADVRFTPVWVDDRDARGRSRFRVLPALAAPPCDDPDVGSADCDRLEGFRAHASEIFPADRVVDDLGPPLWTLQTRIGVLDALTFRYWR
jgi:poly-gamma-glutamate capsule biosynthesis protein CapA/YwtB (metallophosphatase superfamily)